MDVDGPSWERFPCGVRGVGRIRTSGGLRPCCFRDSRIRPLCHHSTDPHEGTNWLTYSCGSRAPGGIRTHDHKVRTLLLWSAELREQSGCLLRFKKSDNPFPKEVIRFFGILLLPRHPRFPPSFRAWSADTTVFCDVALTHGLVPCVVFPTGFEPALIDF